MESPPFFARAYRMAYLILIVADLVLMLDWLGIDGLKQNLDIYLIGVSIFVVNLASWLGYLRGKRWGFEIEQVLSIGRIFMILLGATVYAADIVGLFSAVGLILWYELMFSLLAKSYYLYWAGCATLMVLECRYLWILEAGRGHRDPQTVPAGSAI